MSKTRPLSLKWLVLTGLALSGLPVMAVANEAARLSRGEVISLPITIDALQTETVFPLMQITTPIHQLALASLSGDNSFTSGEQAYLFLKQSGAAWYPYAILRGAPVNYERSEDTVMLRATVSKVTNGQVSLSYSFDTLYPPQSFINAARKSGPSQARIGLATSADGKASISSYYVSDKRFDQRVILKPVLFGGNSQSASSAPPK